MTSVRIETKKIQSEEFIYKFLPVHLKHLLLDVASEKSSVKMIEYLFKNYKISITSLIDYVCATLEFAEYKNYVEIKINDKEKMNGIKLSQLVKLIDYGNLEIHGIKMFCNSLENIQDNIKSLHAFFMTMKQIKGVNNGN